MIEFVRTTGRTRTINRDIPAIKVGPWAGQAKDEADIDAVAKALGRPVHAHTLVEHQEQIVLLVDNGGPHEPREITEWRVVSQERSCQF